MRASPTVRARGKGRKSSASSAGTPIAAKTRTEPETARTNLYDEVTARIITELEAGRVPWVQPWGRPGGTAPGLPRNALTARHDTKRTRPNSSPQCAYRIHYSAIKKKTQHHNT